MQRLLCLSSRTWSGAARATLIFFALALCSPLLLLAAPTDRYYTDGVDVYDDWNICRTNGDGLDGFFQRVGDRFEPVIAAESLGQNADRAYVRGMQFAQEYPSIAQRAEAIFAYARDGVRYTSDYSQFGYPEFAQNADELADVLQHDGIAHGDCEDYAVLLGVMYLGAGLRSAVVLAPEHAAALVYLPDYRKANAFLTVPVGRPVPPSAIALDPREYRLPGARVHFPTTPLAGDQRIFRTWRVCRWALPFTITVYDSVV